MVFNPPRLWFRPKRIGFGWSPGSWEGWALIGALGIAAVAAKSLY